MKKLALLLPSLLVLPLVGCTSEDDIVEHSENSAYAFNSKSIKNWLDVEVELANEVAQNVGHTQLTVTFDINANDKFDDGDIRLRAGNIESSNYSYSRWPESLDFYVEGYVGSTLYRIRQGMAYDIGVKHIAVENIGGAWLYQHKEGSALREMVLGLRFNLDVENPGEHSATLATLIDRTKSINASTPFNVKLTDGDAPESVDYVPGEFTFSQQGNSMHSDSRNDYLGYQRWVDMTAVRYSLNLSN
ncbi:hypothetical protein VV869_16650 [Photobacterium sp. MCCC 1A19761]|uniref:hypothetical protein n=1 Tax=Photobacterium sp. MCCC 1A19761 TaxID=3115000 RepID=UPI00307F2716